MTENDLRAIATYLLDQKGRDGPAPQPIPASDARRVAGAAIFKDRCSACPGDGGGGAPYLFPKLADSGIVQADDPATLIRIVLQGSRAATTDKFPTGPAMRPLITLLTDFGTADGYVAEMKGVILSHAPEATVAPKASSVVLFLSAMGARA